MNWDNVSITFDGVPFHAKTVSIETEPDYGVDLSSLYTSSGTYDLQFTVPLTGGVDDFARLFRREPPGASAITLARRVRYGGRKGRRAWRRLLDRGLPIEITTERATLRGQAAMLSEHEMLVEVRGNRRK